MPVPSSGSTSTCGRNARRAGCPAATSKLTIGRWLATGFKVLLCFDPTRGIDIQTKAQNLPAVARAADEGAAILLYTSELRRDPAGVRPGAGDVPAGSVVDEQDPAAATEESLLSAAHGLQEEAV